MAAVPWRCSSLFLLVISIYLVPCVAPVAGPLVLLVFFHALCLRFFFPEVPEVSGQFFSHLFEFFAQFFYSDVFLLFFVLSPPCLSGAFLVWVFLGMCAKFLFLFLFLRKLLLFSRFSPPGILFLKVLGLFFSSSYSRRDFPCLAIRSCSFPVPLLLAIASGLFCLSPWCHLRHLVAFVPSVPRWMLSILALLWLFGGLLHPYPILLCL